MANAYDASAGEFDMTRLRTADAAYLQGVDRPSTLPEPIARAQGPFITGPQANAIGASESWICGAAVPAAGDIVWVIVNADVHVRRASGTEAAARIDVFPRGVVTNAAYFEGPQLGPGGDIQALQIASGGTNPVVDVPTSRLPSQGMFLPLDPAYTSLGWDVVVKVLAGAGGGMLQNGARLDMLGFHLVGYPANVWGTGALHSVTAFRGS